jgi:phosphatidate phosphatase APP1
MLNVKGKALSVLYAFKLKISAAKLRLGKKLGLIRSVMIMPYQGFGNKRELFFPGRVLRDRGIGISRLEDSKWKNFSTMYKRFMTWEIPFVRVKATLDNISETTVTDEEGYFTFHLSFGNDIKLKIPWQNIQLTLEDEIVKNSEKVQAVTRVYVASDDSEYGIISDIDDTIVPTGSTRVREMLKSTFFHNAHSRVPFPGVAAFYNALVKGSTGFGNNPVFYISSSPWNLYDFLLEFMRVHNIPQGPLMLRDIGPSKEYLIAGSHTAHKLLQVERIFKIISDIPFILIGDSGQHDAEIYLQVIKDFPGRIKMIYIRDVSSTSHDKVLKIAGETQKYGIEMLLVNSTLEAARHAFSRGWITESAVGRVAGEKVADEAES